VYQNDREYDECATSNCLNFRSSNPEEDKLFGCGVEVDSSDGRVLYFDFDKARQG